MIYLKTDEEIEKMRVSNQMVAKTLAEVAKEIKEGVSTLYLDKIAEDFIRSMGGKPSFLGYCGYPNSLCISINETVVHGIPSDKIIVKDGDVVSVDCGVEFNGYQGDSAFTFAVGNVDSKVLDLLKTTRESLYKGIEAAVAGNRIGDIGNAVQTYCEARGYSVVREFVGHGIGRAMHESPELPNYGRKGSGPMLKKGMCIAIEPMINLGKREVYVERDGWTAKTRDGKPAAHFEHTIARTNKGKADILSSFDYIDEVLKNKK